MTALPSKRCVTCGRTLTWRKKWARSWEEVKYCSDGCRRRAPGPAEDALEQAILADLEKRPRGATLCPSEVVRARFEDWRERMPAVREAAFRLEAQSKIAVLQGGKAVDPSRARGPIRLRLAD